jgi:hypothetical protein
MVVSLKTRAIESEENVSWCEYATIPSERNRRNQETLRGGRLEESGSFGRTNHQKGMKDKRPEEEHPKRVSQFFIKGNGIDREVISVDISRYLGNNAVVRPGTYKVCLPYFKK